MTKRDHSLTIPPVGTIDAFALDGAPELYHVDSIELGVVNLTRVSTNTPRRTAFEAALLQRRPRDVEAWRPLIMRDYTLDVASRTALIAEAKAPAVDTDRRQGEDRPPCRQTEHIDSSVIHGVA